MYDKFARSVEAYTCMAALVNNGHSFATLPISWEKAEAIIAFRQQASPDDLRLLKLELNKSVGNKRAVIQK